MRSCQRQTVRRALSVVALAAIAAAAGCSLTRPAPVKETYLLDPANPPVVAKTQPGSLRVGVINVGAPYRARTFTVRETELKYESDFYHEFFVPPGVMIADATARALSVSRTFAQVSRPTAVVEADWVLDGFVGALYADMREAGKPMAVIQVTYYLSRDDGGLGAPVWSKAYFKRAPYTGAGTEAYVSALNGALADILAEMTRDLAAADLPRR